MRGRHGNADCGKQINGCDSFAEHTGKNHTSYRLPKHIVGCKMSIRVDAKWLLPMPPTSKCVPSWASYVLQQNCYECTLGDDGLQYFLICCGASKMQVLRLRRCDAKTSLRMTPFRFSGRHFFGLQFGEMLYSRVSSETSTSLASRTRLTRRRSTRRSVAASTSNRSPSDSTTSPGSGMCPAISVTRPPSVVAS